MPSILESVMSVFDRGDGWADLAASIDGDRDQARSAVESAVPVLVGGLAERAGQDEDGRRAVLDLIDAADESTVDEGLVDGDDAYGRAVLTGVFGDERHELDDGLAERTTIDAAAMDRALPTVASAVMAAVARRRTEDDLDDDAVVALLEAERDQLAEDGDLGDWYQGLVAVGASGAVLAGVGVGADELLDDLLEDRQDVDEDDEVEPVVFDDDEADLVDEDLTAEDLAAEDEELVGDEDLFDEDEGDLLADEDVVVEDADLVADDGDLIGDDEVIADDAELVEADEDEDEDEDADGATAAAAGAGAVAGAVAADPDIDGADVDETDVDPAAEGEVDGAPLAGDVDGAEEAVADDDDTEVAAAPLAGATAAGVTAPAPTDETSPATTTEPAPGRRGLGWLWWALAAIVLLIVLALALSQCGGDDDDGDDAAATAVDDAGSDLQAEVDSVLPAGITASIDGDTVTLTGEVETEDEAVEIADSVAEIDGVGSVVDEMALSEAATTDDDDDDAADEDDDGNDLQAEVDAVLPDGVTAVVEGGFVTLSGTVEDEATAVEAYDAVAAIDGVAEIVDEIEVTGGELSPEELQAEVDAVLPEGVTASIEDEVVTLSGEVATEEEAAEVADAVAGIEGVGSVTDELTVAEADGAADDAEEPTDDAGAAVGTSLNEELGLAPITFRYLSPQVTTSGVAALDQVVAYLQVNDVRLEIQGHTDSDGPEDKNLELSELRAQAVKEYLVAAGIDPNRLDTVGYGESQPKVPNDSLAAKAENRRIELLIVD